MSKWEIEVLFNVNLITRENVLKSKTVNCDEHLSKKQKFRRCIQIWRKNLGCFLIRKDLKEIILGHKVSKSLWGIPGLQKVSA